MFTTPLSTEEYRILVDVKYRPGMDSIQGWALHVVGLAIAAAAIWQGIRSWRGMNCSC